VQIINHRVTPPTRRRLVIAWRQHNLYRPVRIESDPIFAQHDRREMFRDERRGLAFPAQTGPHDEGQRRARPD
jgi:hypothetical protein